MTQTMTPEAMTKTAKTLTLPEAAQLLGVSRWMIYEAAAQKGEIIGVPVLRVNRRVLLPKARFMAALEGEPNGSEQTAA